MKMHLNRRDTESAEVGFSEDYVKRAEALNY